MDVGHPVREVDALEAAGVEDVRVGRAARETEPCLESGPAERLHREPHATVVAPEAVSAVLGLDPRLEAAVGGARGERRGVEDLLNHLGDPAVVVRAHLGLERAPLGHNVPGRAAAYQPDVRGRELVDAPERHVGDRARGGDDR